MDGVPGPLALEQAAGVDGRRFAPARATVPADPATGPEATLLVVDDSPANLTVLVDLLEPHYRVRASTSGARALRIARTKPAPDLILLDVMMPNLSGHDVLAELRGDPETRDIPVVFVTALGAPDDESRGLDLGAADYITKPFHPVAVLSRVRTQLRRTRARAELTERNAALAAQVARGTVENERVQDVTILALARLAQARDRETGNHLRRTQEYVRILGAQLLAAGQHGDVLTPHSIAALAKSAPLHDIGKVAVPDRILLKSGPLTDAEWTIMRMHPAEGRKAIERAERDAGIPVDFLAFAKEICQSHHERWDGSGYPDGLVSMAIPLSARLMAVADVFDALVSNRPYKRAVAPAEARRAIVAERGRHFDPDVVDAFLAAFGQFVAVAERLEDAGSR